MSLKQKTVKGVAWSALDNYSNYAVSFFVGIILARLLSPSDYGIIGLISIFTAISQSFINAGFGNALLRKKNATEDDYNTAFLINFILSLFFYCILYISAPTIAVFFNQESLSELIPISSIGLIISSIAIVQRIQVTKRIDFKTLAIINVSTSLISGIVGICLAFMGHGVWSLVIQGLISTTLSTCLMCYINRWTPKFYFSNNSFKELFGYGSKILASSLIDTIWKQTYQVVVGKFYQTSTLGQYTRALGYSSLLSSNLTNIIQRVTFPVLTEMQDDKERLKEGYRRIIKVAMLISFVCMLLLAATSKSLIIIMIGEKWIQSAQFLQIICLGSMLYPLHALNLNMLQVLGRSDLFLGLEIIKKIIAIGPVLLGIFVGIYWMLIGSFIAGFIAFFLNSYYSGPLINYNSRQQIIDILPSFEIAIIGALCALFPSLAYDLYVTDPQWGVAAFFIFPIQIAIGFTVLYFLLERKKTDEYCEIKNIVLSTINKYKKNVRSN